MDKLLCLTNKKSLANITYYLYYYVYFDYHHNLIIEKDQENRTW